MFDKIKSKPSKIEAPAESIAASHDHIVQRDISRARLGKFADIPPDELAEYKVTTRDEADDLAGAVVVPTLDRFVDTAQEIADNPHIRYDRLYRSNASGQLEETDQVAQDLAHIHHLYAGVAHELQSIIDSPKRLRSYTRKMYKESDVSTLQDMILLCENKYGHDSDVVHGLRAQLFQLENLRAHLLNKIQHGLRIFGGGVTSVAMRIDVANSQTTSTMASIETIPFASGRVLR